MERMPESNFNRKNDYQDFVDNQIEVLDVSQDEFLQMVKNQYPDMPEVDILQMKGFHFVLKDNSQDQIIILLRSDVFPKEYLPYLKMHEQWEAYATHKGGYNLFQKAVRDYKHDRAISDFNNQTVKEFEGELDIYNYEFRHEYAIYKEYEQALKDGRLDEYYQWLLQLREKELLTADDKTKKMIVNDMAIRKSVYERLKNNSKHYFTRNK